MTKKANYSTSQFLETYSIGVLRMVADDLGLTYDPSHKWGVIKALSLELREGRITRAIFDDFSNRHKKQQAMLAKTDRKKAPLRVLFAKQLRQLKLVRRKNAHYGR